jgi:hypothetical protein
VTDIYAARNRDETVRATGRAGGVFRPLCELVVGRGGVVYGVCFDSGMRVVHRRALTMVDCERFSGSKYVQSDVRGCLFSVREDLSAGRFVLFSGTPCQVAGLLCYLSLTATVGDLLTVEVICHGVPSPRVWRDHIALVEAHSGTRVRDYRFRDKANGWHNPRHCAVTDTGEVCDRTVGAFGDVFDYNYALRPSCHVCPFARLERGADLTIGDFWGVERYHPELDDDRGVSLLLVNTEMGRTAIEAIGGALECTEVSVDQCAAPNLLRPTPPSPRRAAFWKAYQRRGYESAIKRYTSYGFARRTLRKLRRAARGWLDGIGF